MQVGIGPAGRDGNATLGVGDKVWGAAWEAAS